MSDTQSASERWPLTQQLEGLFLVADEALSLSELAQATGQSIAEVRDSVYRLQADYDGESDGPQRGFELRAVAGGFRLYVREHLDPLIHSRMQQRPGYRLSQAALETLAVIAYQQPITRAEIAAIRAVNVDSVVRTLVNRELIAEVARHPDTGAAQYGTTTELLIQLGIDNLSELPQISPLIEDHTSDFSEEIG